MTRNYYDDPVLDTLSRMPTGGSIQTPVGISTRAASRTSDRLGGRVTINTSHPMGLPCSSCGSLIPVGYHYTERVTPSHLYVSLCGGCRPHGRVDRPVEDDDTTTEHRPVWAGPVFQSTLTRPTRK
jgi:hypothetical protein